MEKAGKRQAISDSMPLGEIASRPAFKLRNQASSILPSGFFLEFPEIHPDLGAFPRFTQQFTQRPPLT